MMRNYPLFGVALLVVSCSLVFSAYVAIDEVSSFYLISRNHGEEIATVSGIVYDDSGDSIPIYQMTYFVHRSKYVLSSKLFLSNSRFEIGDKIEVIYSVDDPAYARVNSFLAYYLPIILSPIGFLICASLFYLVLRKREWILDKKDDGEYTT